MQFGRELREEQMAFLVLAIKWKLLSEKSIKAKIENLSSVLYWFYGYVKQILSLNVLPATHQLLSHSSNLGSLVKGHFGLLGPKNAR